MRTLLSQQLSSGLLVLGRYRAGSTIVDCPFAGPFQLRNQESAHKGRSVLYEIVPR